MIAVEALLAERTDSVGDLLHLLNALDGGHVCQAWRRVSFYKLKRATGVGDLPAWFVVDV